MPTELVSTKGHYTVQCKYLQGFFHVLRKVGTCQQVFEHRDTDTNMLVER